MDKVSYLCWLQNRFGDFKICCRFRDKDNKLCWSKRYSVRDLHFDSTRKSRWLLQHATDRTPLKCELILDYDKFDIDDDQTMLIHVNYICTLISKYKYDMYFSGSKGYHFHVRIPEIVMMSKRDREKFRAKIIYDCACDSLKKSDEHMIAIEHNPHPKTLKKKRRLVNKWLLNKSF